MDLKAEKKSLKNLLAVDEQQFRIPPYQRPYAWTSDQVDDLWDDLIDNLDGGHFLGSLVLAAEDESRPQVIDGQQRLTTLMLLMAALREESHARGMTKQVQRITGRLTADDLADGDAAFKFKTGSANWPVFRDVVLRGPDDDQRKAAGDFDKATQGRNRPLLANLARLRGRLSDLLAGLSEQEQRLWLERFHKFLMEKVELVVIEVKSLADAFLLFETLNDRGLALSAADLLKSHLLGEVAKKADSEDVDQAAAAWDALLDDLGAAVDVSRFLRHYLLARYPKVQKDDVFGVFKKLIADQGADAVLHDLRIAAGDYGDFEDPGRVSHEPTRAALQDLQTLRAMTCYIALLPARRYLSVNDFLDFARLAEVLTYRYSSVAGRGTNDLERRYHEAAKLLLDSDGAKLAEARAVLIGTMPDSTEFGVAFERLTMSKQYLLRYSLAKIEQHLSDGAEKQIKTSDLVHIEHVMPQTLSDAWRTSLGPDVERHQEYLNRWGNLTLFYGGYNIPASNKGFDEKKEYYSQSDVALTASLCEIDTWGIEQIETRQRWLAEVADKLWSAGPSSVLATPATDATVAFRDELGALWEAVEPFCQEVSAEEIRSLAQRLPDHLAAHAANRGYAAQLATQLADLLDGWADYDAGQRSVARAAAAYFLEDADALPDHEIGGLTDDAAVVQAATVALLSK